SWYGPLDYARGVDELLSPYDEAFQNPKVFRPASPMLALNASFEIPGNNRIVPLASSATSDPYPAAVAAACRLTLDDLRLRVAPGGAPPAGGVTNDLTRANVSALVRIGSLCRVLGVSVPEYLRLIALLGPMDPFRTSGTADPKATEAFLDAVEF